MRPSFIRESPATLRPAPNLVDHEAVRRRFSWDAVRAELGAMPGDGVNIAYAAVAGAWRDARARRGGETPIGGGSQGVHGGAAARPRNRDAARDRRGDDALRDIPHYYLATDIPLARASRWLTGRNAQQSVTERVLMAVSLLKAVALALERYPELNGFFRDEDRGMCEPGV
ncbi:MAG: 2-oxo acid dehydrogenase subunit E2 [Burkholderiales bacterium]|nr:2-oxo acid dehydrogenase subunit E2 [Burkholderiales bacterium]